MSAGEMSRDMEKKEQPPSEERKCRHCGGRFRVAITSPEVLCYPCWATDEYVEKKDSTTPSS